MAATATLNIRLPEPLKAHGSQVLESNGISASQAVRRLYEYMEREQAVPDCIAECEEPDKYEKRRALAREFAGCAELPSDWTRESVKDERLSRLIDGRLS